MKGSINVDELIIPIVDIRLDYRMILFTGRLPGPVPAGTYDTYTVHDAEGRVVFRVEGIGDLSWHAVDPGSFLVIEVPLQLYGFTAYPSGEPHPRMAAR